MASLSELSILLNAEFTSQLEDLVKQFDKPPYTGILRRTFNEKNIVSSVETPKTEDGENFEHITFTLHRLTFPDITQGLVITQESLIYVTDPADILRLTIQQILEQAREMLKDEDVTISHAEFFSAFRPQLSAHTVVLKVNAWFRDNKYNAEKFFYQDGTARVRDVLLDTVERRFGNG